MNILYVFTEFTYPEKIYSIIGITLTKAKDTISLFATITILILQCTEKLENLVQHRKLQMM